MLKKYIHTFLNNKKMAVFAVQLCLHAAKEAINKKGYFTLALSGGKTPYYFFKELVKSKDSFDWGNIFIFLVDERFVSHAHKDSNYKFIYNNLLQHVPIKKNNVFDITIKENAAFSAQDYEEKIAAFFNLQNKEFPRFDVIMLGMGEDGHVASLFPGNDAIYKKKHSVISTKKMDAFGEVTERVTITLPVINNAENVVFLISGSAKAAVVKKVLSTKSRAIPASLVYPLHGKLYFLLDRDADLYRNNNCDKIRRSTCKHS